MTPVCGEEIISTKPRWKRVFVCIFCFVGFVYVVMCPPALHNIYFIVHNFIRLWHDIFFKPICAENAVKHLETKPSRNVRVRACRRSQKFGDVGPAFWD